MLGVPLALLVATMAGASCSKSPAGLAAQCSINSDCNSPLVCVFSHCHQACAETRDCPSPERCVAAGSYDVCTLPSDETCSTPGSACPTGLTCASGECRNACQSTTQCIPGQVCVSNACVETASALDAGLPDSETEGGGLDTGTADGAGHDGAGVDGKVSDAFSGDAGPLGYTPSNFNPGTIPVDGGDGGMDWNGAPAVTVSTSCTSTAVGCLPISPVTVGQTGGMFADVYVLKSLTVTSTGALTLVGPNPIIFAVLGAVDIEGSLLANGRGSGGGATAGPGGYLPGTQPGPGAGQGACLGEATTANSGSGAASYCGLGGAGGAGSGTAAVGGMPYGTPDLAPLWGGSAGGICETIVPGPGGGAVQISSGLSITVGVAGAINAGGGGGQEGTGGGSGGAILLEAPLVTIDGTLAANGGGGGQLYANTGSPGGEDGLASAQPALGGNDGAHSGVGGNGSAGTTLNGGNGAPSTTSVNYGGGGGGGAGRIRINTPTGAATIGSAATVSPALSTTCATQGTLGP